MQFKPKTGSSSSQFSGRRGKVSRNFPPKMSSRETFWTKSISINSLMNMMMVRWSKIIFTTFLFADLIDLLSALSIDDNACPWCKIIIRKTDFKYIIIIFAVPHYIVLTLLSNHHIIGFHPPGKESTKCKDALENDSKVFMTQKFSPRGSSSKEIWMLLGKL